MADKSPDSKDRLQWKWLKGTATSVADFGAPLTATDYGRDHHPRCFTIWMAGGGVRPGLTGLTQVYASRDICRTSKFRLDRLYLKRAGFCLDVRLILLSFWITGCGQWENRNRRG